MKKMFFLFAFAGFITGCYYDNEEQLYPKLNKDCDTTGIGFAKSILPILQTNCYGCHSTRENAASGGGLDLENFQTIKQLVDGGFLYGSITHNPLNLPMPKDGNKLDTCAITKIKIWIDKGAQNN
jgi:hypothetical protein